MQDPRPDSERFDEIPRRSLTTLGSPVEPCERLAARVSGMPRLFVKRDDMLGSLVGGNKLRKLEYTMADALERGATAIVTVGGVQSNMARITAQVARRLGLGCELVLSGERPARSTGNFLVGERLGARVHFVADRTEREIRAAEVASDLERRGERVARGPLGASDEIGSLGYVRAFRELLEQEPELGVRFDAVYVSSSSGGTQAGLEVGKRVFGEGTRPRIVGVSPDDPAESIRQTVTRIGNAMLERVASPARIDPAELVVDADFIGDGYGAATEGSREATELFADEEGILLDPIYTAKAAAALIAHARDGKLGSDSAVLFWHTGGLLNLFD